MKCDFVITHRKANRVKQRCIRCHRDIGWTETVDNPFRVCLKAGWGDLLHVVLSHFTTMRPCPSCESRRRRLNELDRKLYRKMRGPKHASYTVR